MKRRDGWTWIELVVLTGFLVALAGLIAVNTGIGSHGCGRPARVNATHWQISAFEEALSQFEKAMGRFPTEDEGPEALIENPDGSTDWSGPYLKSRTVPKDAWKNDFVYRLEPKGKAAYTLYSPGPDGQEGTEDDIGNWDKDEEK